MESRPARKNDRKGESKFTEAADKATAVLQDLQSRLSREPAPAPDPADELERELQEYFSAPVSGAPPARQGSQASVLNQIHERVIEGVVDRILESWADPRAPRAGALEDEVVERLIARVLEKLGNGSTNAPRRFEGSRASR